MVGDSMFFNEVMLSTRIPAKVLSNNQRQPRLILHKATHKSKVREVKVTVKQTKRGKSNA
jgi:hypothetical protein